MRIGYDAKRIFHNRVGLGNYSRDLIRILSTHYPENRYLLYNPKKGGIKYAPAQENIEIHYPLSAFDKKFSSLWRRGPIVRQLKADHLAIYHGLSNELPAGIGQSNIRTVVTIHDLIFMRYPQWYSKPDKIMHTLKVKHAAKNAHRIIAISEQTKKDIIDFLHIPREKINVIYQGCHKAFRQPYSSERQNDVRKKFNLPDRFLLNVGTIEERKNLLTIVKSLKYHPLPLVVIGKETKYTEKVKQYILHEKLQDRVHFLPNVSMEELAVIYRLAAIFCYPSVFEGFGIPIIEALYSRAPVITSKGGCFPEAGGPHSIYIDPFDEEMLGEKVNMLLNDAGLSDRMASEGFKFVQQFNDEAIGSQIMTLYNNLVSC